MSSDNNSLRRRLRGRHLSMIALGGSIGTGLFVTSGSVIYSAGPLGAILAFAVLGVLVYLIMTSLSEMTAFMPVSGTFCKYSSDFVGPAFGLTMGYNYFFNWAITIAVELSASAYIMRYWFPNTPLIEWSALFFILILVINLLPVRIYGESEYWLSSIKVAAVIVFIAIGALLATGLIGNHSASIPHHAVSHVPHLFHGGWGAWLATLMVVGFSFQGTELVGVAAGETVDPQRNIPRAARSVFWRILMFYVLTMLIISLVIPTHDPRLLHADAQHLGMSPFTIVLVQAGLHHAASVMNFIILIAVLSACNSDMYSATRILWHLAEEGDAPRCLSRTNRFGVPVPALLVTAVFGGFTFLSSLFGSGVVFFWLVNISSLAGFIAWFAIAICHYCFRREYLATGRSLEALPYRARFYPFGPIFCMASCLLIIFGQVFVLITDHQLSLGTIAATYITIPFLLLIWICGRLRLRRKTSVLARCSA